MSERENESASAKVARGTNEGRCGMPLSWLGLAVQWSLRMRVASCRCTTNSSLLPHSVAALSAPLRSRGAMLPDFPLFAFNFRRGAQRTASQLDPKSKIST